MKKLFKKVIITLSLMIIMCFIIYVIIVIFRPCGEPERVKGVPISAVWHGGCDGGFWFELVERKSNIFRFRIYNDGSGLLLFDADFRVLDDCKEKIRYIKDIHNVINYYNNEMIFLTVVENNKYCRLIMLKPTYYKFK